MPSVSICILIKVFSGVGVIGSTFTDIAIFRVLCSIEA